MKKRLLAVLMILLLCMCMLPTYAFADDVTIRFTKYEGSGEMTNATAVKGSDYEVPDCGFTAPEGKSFLGWLYEGKVYKKDTALSKISIPADFAQDTIQLTALWDEPLTVTYQIVNGEWADGTNEAKTEKVAKNAKPANVPTGMQATAGYGGGAWNTEPSSATITSAATPTASKSALIRTKGKALWTTRASPTVRRRICLPTCSGVRDTASPDGTRRRAEAVQTLPTAPTAVR